MYATPDRPHKAGDGLVDRWLAGWLQDVWSTRRNYCRIIRDAAAGGAMTTRSRSTVTTRNTDSLGLTTTSSTPLYCPLLRSGH